MKHSVYIALLIVSVVFVLTSLFFPVTVYIKAEFFEVPLGWPLAFVLQNQREYAPYFPWQTHIYSVWENPIRILWTKFFLNIAIVFGALSIVLNLIRAIILRTSRR